VSLKLLLDAARGLAYMHEVDVVHGDVKSRNLLVFWEEDDEDQDQQQQQQEGGPAAANEQKQQLVRTSSARPPVWGLKWCDFGVSFRAAEAPGGILRQVGLNSALLLCCCGCCALHG
jgi:serine/threonine protein kinase